MAKVIKAFYDASCGRLYRTGEQYDGDRVDELATGGYVAAPRKTKKKESKESKEQDTSVSTSQEVEETEQK